MRFRIDSVITVTDPTKELIEYVNSTLRVINPQYYKLQKMGRRVYGMPREISFFWWDNGKLVLPRGLLKTIYKMYPDLTLYENELYKPKDIIFDADDIKLRDYQVPAVGITQKGKQGIIKMPCGAGKTETGIEIIVQLKKPALWITHTKDLLNQSLERAVNKLHLKPGQFGVIGGGKYSIGSHITFATVQSLAQKDLEEIKYRFGTIVIDECHRAFISPNKATLFSKVINSLPAAYRIGLTASAHRSDGLVDSMYHLIGDLLYEVTQEQLNSAGNVIVPKVIAVPTRYEYSGEAGMDFSAMLAEMAEDAERNMTILEYLKENKENYCLVLSDRLTQLQFLYDNMVVLTPCEFIEGSTPKKERRRALQHMKSGKSKMFFATYSLAKEGLDIPRLDRLFLATPHRDKVTIQQSVGRIMRPFKDKKEPIVYDFVDVEIGLCMSQYRSRKSVYKTLDCTVLDCNLNKKEYSIKMA